MSGWLGVKAILRIAYSNQKWQKPFEDLATTIHVKGRSDFVLKDESLSEHQTSLLSFVIFHP